MFKPNNWYIVRENVNRISQEKKSIKNFQMLLFCIVFSFSKFIKFTFPIPPFTVRTRFRNVTVLFWPPFVTALLALEYSDHFRFFVGFVVLFSFFSNSFFV